MNCKNKFVLVDKVMPALCVASVVLGMLFLPASGVAQTVTMDDSGSIDTINAGNSGTLGMNSWTVGGVPGSQLNQQWFWYSISGVDLGAGIGVAVSINTIGTASVTDNNYGADGLNDVTLVYANASLSVSVEYALSGNGYTSGSADLMESLAIQNLTAGSLGLKFYQYSNFNLLQNNHNVVTISGSPSGGYSGAQQTTGGPGGSGIAEVINAPNANYGEANIVNNGVNSTLYKLNNTANLQLNDQMSAGPDNVTWAFQWNATLQPNGSVDANNDPTDTLFINKDKGLSVQLVPEPSTLAFIALGLGAWGLARRRQSA